MATCQALGLRTKYIGSIGDDERGRIQLESLQSSGIDLEHLQVRRGCANQSAYIVVDEETGERTIFWRRDDCLRNRSGSDPRRPDHPAPGCLHIDGHDTPAVERAASIAREAGIPVTVDVDTIYRGFDRVLPLVDYLVASAEFPARWTGKQDPFRALELLQAEHNMKAAAMTLGSRGALAYASGRFLYSPAFRRGLRGHYRSGGRVSRGILLWAARRVSAGRGSRFFERDGGLELPGFGGPRRHRLGRRGPRIDGLGRETLFAGVLRTHRPRLTAMFPLRDDAPRFDTPFITLALIVVNVAVFVYQFSLAIESPGAQQTFIETFGAIPLRAEQALAGRYPLIEGIGPVFTSVFLHGGWLHLIGNMWFSVDLRRQRRRRVGPLHLSVVLSGLRTPGIPDAHPGEPGIDGAGGRSERRHRGRHGRLPGEVPVRQDHGHWFGSSCSSRRSSCLPSLMLVYWFAIQFFSGAAETGGRRHGRRRVVGARRRVRGRRGSDLVAATPAGAIEGLTIINLHFSPCSLTAEAHGIRTPCFVSRVSCLVKTIDRRLGSLRRRNAGKSRACRDSRG